MSAVQLLTALVIGLAVALSSLRILGTGPDRRWPQRGVLILLQIVATMLLWWALFPPGDESPKRELTVLTAGTESVAPELWAGHSRVVALPEVGALAGLDRTILHVPDLATALRGAPNLERIRVIGHGLPPRDQQFNKEIAVEFIAAPRRPGLIELDHPESVAAGRAWSLRVRIAASPGASIVLRDAADIEVARAASANDSEFSLDVPGAPAGQLTYRLELLDAADQLIESLTIPVRVEPGAALRVALLSGAPNPELKYLRRWTVDAGLAVDSRIVLTRGAQLGDGPERWDAANLSDYDLLVFDERAWEALDPAEQQAIVEAVQAGLGLMIRLTAQPSATLQDQLAALGFQVEEADIARSVRLAGAANTATHPALPVPNERATPIELARRPLKVTGTDAVALLRNTDAEALGLWRGRGRGRVGLLWLTDSYRLVLAGDDSAHNGLWSDLFATLARGQDRRRPQWQSRHRWPQQRAVVCGLRAPAEVLGANAATVRLIPDPDANAEACAGFWPRESGWHLLRHGGAEHAFYVLPADAGAGLRAELDRAAMPGLAAGRPGITTSDNSAKTSLRSSRWPGFIGWLVLSGLLWWRERRVRTRTNV